MSAAERITPITPLEYALAYAARGWSVVPVRRGEKMPAVAWSKYQTLPADKATIRGWFDADPAIGLGLVQGRCSGSIVLDFDAAAGGMETLSDLEGRGLPHTVRALTPGGGVHTYFKHPGRPIATRKGVLTGMDVRGDGGFVVAPPSIHANGRAYAWDVDCHPDETQLADLPDWLLAAVEAPQADAVHLAEVSREAGPLGLPGRVTDGREAYMRDTVLAVCRSLRDRLRRLPSEDELFQEAWPQYARNVDFSRPGRGVDEMLAKVRITLRRAEAGLIRGFEKAGPSPVVVIATAAGEVGSAGEVAAQPEYDPETGEVVEFPATPFDPAELANIPAREWVYGHFLIKRFVSVLGAPGGTGKTAYAIAVALAVALGQELLGEKVHRDGAAWIYNLEDPRDELLRRVHAGVLAHKVDPAALAGRLFLDSGRDRPLVIAAKLEDGRVVAMPVVDHLVTELRRRGVVLLIVDPFVKSHQLEENRNEQIDFAATQWGKVAEKAGCAILLVHHFRKGATPGEADAFRGASALVDASRAAVALSVMSENEADKFGIETDKRRFYVRADNAKLNLAPPPDQALWMELRSVDLPNGDKVQAVVPWELPSPWDGIPAAMVLDIIERLSAGQGEGVKWSPRKEAKDGWAGALIMETAGKTEGQAATVLRAWEQNGVLIRVKYNHPKLRRERDGYDVDQVKLSEMRQAFSGSGGGFAS